MNITVTHVVVVQNFEVMSDKFIVIGICTSRSCSDKWCINYIIVSL